MDASVDLLTRPKTIEQIETAVLICTLVSQLKVICVRVYMNASEYWIIDSAY